MCASDLALDSAASVGWQGAGCSVTPVGVAAVTPFSRGNAARLGASMQAFWEGWGDREINRGRKIEREPAVWNGCCRYWFRSLTHHFKNPQRTFSHTHALTATQMMPCKSLVCVYENLWLRTNWNVERMWEKQSTLWSGLEMVNGPLKELEMIISHVWLSFSHYDRPGPREAGFLLQTESLFNFVGYFGQEMPTWIGNNHLNSISNSQLHKFFGQQILKLSGKQLLSSLR